MTRFYRLSGGGNDFLALVEPDRQPTPDHVRSWCQRGLSVGADGLFVLERTDAAIVMTYYNADGTVADLCLNGTRCAVQLAAHLGWSNGTTVIQTGAGHLVGHPEDSSCAALALPRPEPPLERAPAIGSTSYSVWSVLVGVPHIVLDWNESLRKAPVADLGPRLRSHPNLGTEGANVDFARFIDRGRIEIRTFERGVEAETLACGTGVLAAVAVGLATAKIDLPTRAMTQGGFALRVAESQDRGSWQLSGDARIVSKGELLNGASELPRPPDWTD